MPIRDFFSFCTSLKPIELKALGSLSRVRHLDEDEIIYRTGDPSGAIFIINRGIIEMTQRNSAILTDATYLSRGDIFGDVELLTNLPRKHCVRAHGPASLQCFEGEHLPELMKRVPAFYHYLSEQLANRLLQARDAAFARSNCNDLGGSLSNFDLVTIYQTIVNSSQTGELTVADEAGELIAAFYFESGQPRGGQFQHLTGEEAFSQLFLAEDLRGSFSFRSGTQRISQTIQGAEFVRNSDEMLLKAVQGRDEMRALREELAQPSRRLQRITAQLAIGQITPQLRATAEDLWQLMSHGSLALRDLYPKCDRCELKIHQAARELIATGHCVLSEDGEAQNVA